MLDTLGKRLRKLRKNRDWNQHQVAEKVNVHEGTVSSYENDIREPNLSTLVRLADLFDVSTDYLLGMKVRKSVNVSKLSIEDVLLVEDYAQRLEETASHNTME